jgi:EAL domain-containing protein (putative c-di-GMP-specific phosphodiesterase class I)
MDRAPSPPAPRDRRSPTPGAAQKREAIHRLKTALEGERFMLCYQPIVSIADARVDRVEALLRWRTPQPEQALLTDLIWSAERSPVIFGLENWTLHQACHAASAWRGAGLALRVNVNVSTRQFTRADLVDRLTRQLSSTGLQPHGLGLEITETSRMSDFTAVADELQRLMAMGIELWLDDFGTGHSSLDWLSRLPCHGVKIPGTFVERLFTDDRCRAIVSRVVQLAHDLGLRVIGEGVETERQRDFLTDLGCDLLQGFLFQAPIPAEELPAALSGAPTRPA